MPVGEMTKEERRLLMRKLYLAPSLLETESSLYDYISQLEDTILRLTEPTPNSEEAG